MFVRRENFQQFRRFYPVTTAFIGINLLVFLVRMIFGPSNLVYGLGIGSNLHVHAGQYWRLVTPIFLHANFAHFIFNSFMIVILGPAAERMLGKFRFTILYLGAGIAGNLGTYFAGGLRYPLHLGASGAVFGLMGFYAFLMLIKSSVMDSESSRMIKGMLAINLVYTFIRKDIAVYSHLFGLVGGLVISYLFYLLRPKRKVTRLDDHRK